MGSSIAIYLLMRLSRTLQLQSESGAVHLFWRCHNKEYYLSDNHNKSLYMQAVKDGLSHESSKGFVKIHSYCVMNNHYHQSTSYSQSSMFLSNYMRYTHGLFGARYNRKHDRSGKVAESRPKTSLTEDISHEMRVHFYIEANPIRAGLYKFENLKLYKYSSFRFYAHGIEDEFTQLLEIPSWYEELGKNPIERQVKYRKLFQQYLDDTDKSRTDKELYKKAFIGTLLWTAKHEARVKNTLKSNSS